MGEDLYRLGDGCQIRHGFAFKGEHMVESEDVSLPIVVNIGNFKYDGGFRFESTRNQRYTGAFPDEYVMSPGTLLLVMTCQTAGGEILGVPGRVPDDGRRYLHNQRLGRVVIARPDELDPGYLYYLFLSRPFNAHLAGTASGSKILHTSPDRIMNFRWRRPPIDTQRRIAAVLSAYDALIDNNTKRIRALEEMARAVYREWFVHFRYPGHSGSRSSWPRRPLRELAEINARQVDLRAAPEEIGYIDIASVGVGRIEQVTQMRFDDAPGRARRVVRHGDILWSCVRPNRRSHALVLHPQPDTIASTGFAVLTARAVPFVYLYFATTTEQFVGHLVGHATGSAYPAVTAATFEAAEIDVPEARLADAFARHVDPIVEMQHWLHERNRALREARDLLLPKLLSGALAVDGIALP
jgi:type I restriction enzyme S subunit